MTTTLDVAATRYKLPADTQAVVVARTLDARFLNEIANHPDVRPWLGGAGVLDMSALIENPDNISVVAEHGGFIGVALGYGTYEVHSMFLPDGRGAEACAAMRAGLAYLFGSTDAIDVVTKVPADNRAALALTKRAGFESRFTSQIPFASATELVDAEFFGLTLERWTLRTDLTLALGQWFHQAVALVKTAADSPRVVHPDSETHDRMVGLAVLLCRAGNVLKAVQVYNTWARFACYTPIVLLRHQPIILDLGDVVVEVRNQEMEILTCR